MLKPSPQSYGISQLDVPKLELREKRVAWVTRDGIAVAGGLIGCLAGLFLGRDDVGKLFSAILGGVAVSGIGRLFGTDIAYPLALKFDVRLQQYAAFAAAFKAFKDWEERTRADFWRSLSGHQFERELARLLSKQEYERVVVTRGSGDKGIDIILEKSGRTTLVQCKQTRTPVGPAVSRELYGTLIASKADDAILATVGGATAAVYEFCRDKPIRIMDLAEILRLHEQEPVGS
jgi:hypothetical protein